MTDLERDSKWERNSKWRPISFLAAGYDISDKAVVYKILVEGPSVEIGDDMKLDERYGQTVFPGIGGQGFLPHGVICIEIVNDEGKEVTCYAEYSRGRLHALSGDLPNIPILLRFAWDSEMLSAITYMLGSETEITEKLKTAEYGGKKFEHVAGAPEPVDLWEFGLDEIQAERDFYGIFDSEGHLVTGMETLSFNPPTFYIQGTVTNISASEFYNIITGYDAEKELRTYLRNKFLDQKKEYKNKNKSPGMTIPLPKKSDTATRKLPEDVEIVSGDSDDDDGKEEIPTQPYPKLAKELSLAVNYQKMTGEKFVINSNGNEFTVSAPVIEIPKEFAKQIIGSIVIKPDQIGQIGAIRGEFYGNLRVSIATNVFEVSTAMDPEPEYQPVDPNESRANARERMLAENMRKADMEAKYFKALAEIMGTEKNPGKIQLWRSTDNHYYIPHTIAKIVHGNTNDEFMARVVNGVVVATNHPVFRGMVRSWEGFEAPKIGAAGPPETEGMVMYRDIKARLDPQKKMLAGKRKMRNEFGEAMQRKYHPEETHKKGKAAYNPDTIGFAPVPKFKKTLVTPKWVKGPRRDVVRMREMRAKMRNLVRDFGDVDE